MYVVDGCPDAVQERADVITKVASIRNVPASFVCVFGKQGGSFTSKSRLHRTLERKLNVTLHLLITYSNEKHYPS